MIALDVAPHDRTRLRTTALPACGFVISRFDTSYDSGSNASCPNHHGTPIWSTKGHHAVLCIDLVRKAWLDSWSNRITASPHVLVIRPQATPVVRQMGILAAPRTTAQRTVTELRSLSGLTNEEIAPLAGVSRRSLQAWLAGAAISARKEQRLRALVDAVRSLAARDAVTTRDRLLDRAPGCVRPYDLMVEGRFEAAVDLALGRRSNAPSPASRSTYDLATQLDHVEDRVDVPEGRLNRRLSGSLRR